MVTKRRGLLTLIAAGLAALLHLGRQAEANSETSSQADQSPAGTWVITGARADGSLRSTTFVALTADGSFFRAGENHPLESPGVGAWTRVGEHEFEVTYVALQFDVDGSFRGSRKSWQRLTMNSTFDEFTGVSRGEEIDRDGAILSTRTDPRPLQGRRFRAEPFA